MASKTSSDITFCFDMLSPFTIGFRMNLDVTGSFTLALHATPPPGREHPAKLPESVQKQAVGSFREQIFCACDYDYARRTLRKPFRNITILQCFLTATRIFRIQVDPGRLIEASIWAEGHLDDIDRFLKVWK
jgi:hypothetical protein